MQRRIAIQNSGIARRRRKGCASQANLLERRPMETGGGESRWRGRGGVEGNERLRSDEAERVPCAFE